MERKHFTFLIISDNSSKRKSNCIQSGIPGENESGTGLSFLSSCAAAPHYEKFLRIWLRAPFSRRDTCACEMPISLDTSIWVLP